MGRAYLNGQWLKLEEAKVSVMDRGFLFGDGVYEVIPVYSRHPFRLEQHLQRLQASLDGIQLANPHTQDEWLALVKQIVAEADWDDQSIYIQITRGPIPVRNQVFQAVVRPTVFLLAEALPTPTAAQVDKGMTAISAADIRWLRCDLKTTSLLANCLLRQQAVAAGCDETVLFRDGCLTEASVSSIFLVEKGVLLAPAKTHLMLPGITYDVILELASEHGLAVKIGDISEQQVRQADELWLASSTREVQAIVELDGQKIGQEGKPGPHCIAMQRWYQAYKASEMRRG